MSRIREMQRAEYALLQGSANETSTRLRISLNTNGYGDLKDADADYSFLMLCKYEDRQLLKINIEWLLYIYRDEIRSLHILTDSNPNWGDFQKFFRNYPQVKFSDETKYLNQMKYLEVEIDKYRPVRRSWIRQQILKIIYVSESPYPIVILDCDTFLMKNFQFAAREKQIMFAGGDFHSSYSKHVHRFLGIMPTALSFVHHCQVQFPKIIRELYFESKSLNLLNWLSMGEKLAEYSAVSEFQTYGDYMLNNYADRVQIKFHDHHEISLNSVSLNKLWEFLILHKETEHCDLVTIMNKEILKLDHEQ